MGFTSANATFLRSNTRGGVPVGIRRIRSVLGVRLTRPWRFVGILAVLVALCSGGILLSGAAADAVGKPVLAGVTPITGSASTQHVGTRADTPSPLGPSPARWQQGQRPHIVGHAIASATRESLGAPIGPAISPAVRPSPGSEAPGTSLRSSRPQRRSTPLSGSASTASSARPHPNRHR